MNSQTMHEQGRKACKALHDYMLEDDNLFDQLRMMWDWNDREFQRLVGLATRCLEETAEDDMIPRYVASFFGYWLGILKGTLQNPQFIQFNRAGRSEEETRDFFSKRIEIIHKLTAWMSRGRSEHPPEHFNLPEWEDS